MRFHPEQVAVLLWTSAFQISLSLLLPCRSPSRALGPCCGPHVCGRCVVKLFPCLLLKLAASFLKPFNDRGLELPDEILNDVSTSVGANPRFHISDICIGDGGLGVSIIYRPLEVAGGFVLPPDDWCHNTT